MMEISLFVWLRNFAGTPPEVFGDESLFQHFHVEHTGRSICCSCSIKHPDSYGPLGGASQLEEMRRILRTGQDLKSAGRIDEYFISCFIIMARRHAEFEIPLDLVRLFTEFPDLPSLEIEVEYIRNGVAP